MDYIKEIDKLNEVLKEDITRELECLYELRVDPSITGLPTDIFIGSSSRSKHGGSARVKIFVPGDKEKDMPSIYVDGNNKSKEREAILDPNYTPTKNYKNFERKYGLDKYKEFSIKNEDFLKEIEKKSYTDDQIRKQLNKITKV